MELPDILRAQAWERAKGELRSMLYTFNGPDADNSKFLLLSFKITEFIEDVDELEDSGLYV